LRKGQHVFVRHMLRSQIVKYNLQVYSFLEVGEYYVQLIPPYDVAQNVAQNVSHLKEYPG
jgi:hypothetical protein